MAVHSKAALSGPAKGPGSRVLPYLTSQLLVKLGTIRPPPQPRHLREAMHWPTRTG